MNVTAKIIADSLNIETRDRLTTMLVRIPRCILAEQNTHRAFSRNSASSRAIPTKTFRERVNADPYKPDAWLSAVPGMAAGAELNAADSAEADKVWNTARLMMDGCHRQLEMLGVAKQIANRLLEPWLYTEVLVSATDWQNYFALRSNAQADPAIQAVSDAALAAYCASTPKELNPGEWHLPFSGSWPAEGVELTLAEKIAVCTARAARTSYFGFDGQKSLSSDTDLYTKLSESGHWSPFEHVAQAVPACSYDSNPRIGNFTGWHQHRYDFPRQNRQCDLKALLLEREQVSPYARTAA